MPASLPLECADSLWVYIVGQQENHWKGLCGAIKKVKGEESLSTDKRFKDRFLRIMATKVLDDALRDIFSTEASDVWLEALWAEGVPAGPVHTVDRVVEDPQVLARNMVMAAPLPPKDDDDNDHSMKVIGNPIKTVGERDAAIGPPPNLGADTDEVLTELLSLSPDEIQRLRDEKII